MDPSGYKIQLTGSKEDKDTVLSEMQKLTDHKLAYNKKGDVYISEFAYAYNLFFKSIDGRKIPKNFFDARHLAGNQLIEGMIDSKNTTSIVVDRSISNGYTDLLDEENASKSGSDTTITFNPDFAPEMYVQIPRTKKLELERTDPFIVLAHEMIHADRAMRGNYISEGKAYQHAFFSRYSKFLWFEHEVYKYEPIAMEEAQTVGFVSSFSITEDMIREEQGINLRGRYTLD